MVASPFAALDSLGNFSLVLEWDRSSYLNSGCMYIRHAQQHGGRHSTQRTQL